MWNESRVLSWPLMFRRQYAQPLDIDSVFGTLAEMNTYLTNTLRHVGQIATCQETEGVIYIMNNNRDAWVTVDAGSGSLVFTTTTELNNYLSNDIRIAGGIATCLETEGILYIMNNLRTAWISIDFNSKLNSIEFYSHTGDTSIHYTKNSIDISDINSAHTHSIQEIPNLQDGLNSKLNLSGGTLSGTLNALTIIANDYSGITTSMVYNDTSLSGETIQDIFEDSIASEATTILLDDLLVGGRIEDINGVNTQVNKYWTWELLRDDIITNIPSDFTALNAHTGDTSIHFTKESINISDINSAHTHTITDVTDLQNELNSKTDLVLFNAHSGETNPHLTEFSDLITTAHTHTISDTENLQTELNFKLNLTGGTLTGDLIGTTIIATNYSGITSSMITNTSSLSGDTITDVLNASEAIQKTGITNSDILIGQRIGEGNVYWDYQVIKNDTRNGLLSSDVFYTHTGDTSIHFTKDSINITDINSAHTHVISDVINLQEDLNLKTNLTLFSTHTGETNPHLTEFSDLIITAHTHEISDTINLQTVLNSKLNLSGGELTGNLTAVTYYGDGSHLTGIVSDATLFNAHTGDTSIHFTKNNINISDINSAHTHIISDVSNLQTSLNNKTDLSLFSTHSGQTNPHQTNFFDLITTAHTHTISDVSDLQTSLNSKLNLSGGTIIGNLTAVTYYGDGSHLTGIVAGVDIADFNAHTGDTSIHYTKNSINISDINSAHTHGISEVLNLQTSLNNKTDLTLFSTHTGQTNPHLTKFSDLIVTAHTHTIADVSNLQTSLNGKLSLTGGTMTGTLIGTTISATTYQGIKASYVVNDSTNVSGANLKVILDNATLAIDGVTIQDADLFPISREVQSGATFVSTNMYHSWDRIKTEIKTNSGVRFVANETDLISALQSNVDSMCIVITEPITTTNSFNCIPTNIHISGHDIIYTGGTMHFISTNPSTSVYFDCPIAISKSGTNTSVISTSGETAWDVTFRNIVSERPLTINSNGVTTGRMDIIITNDMSINVSGSTGTRSVTINNRIDNTGFYYRGFSQQGYNQVYSEITDSGNFTVKAHLTFQKDEVGSIILIPSNSNVMLHPSKFTITYLKSDLVNIGATGIYGNIDFPRFDGEGEQVTLSLSATNKAERYIYIVPDGNGSVDYNSSNERAIMLENGNWVLNFTGSTLGATQQNRVWYSIVINGHADTTSGNWISI